MSCRVAYLCWRPLIAAVFSVAPVHVFAVSPADAREASLAGAAVVLLSVLIVVIAHAWQLRRRLRESEKVRTGLDAARASRLASLESFAAMSSEWYWEQDAEYRFTLRSTWNLGGKSLPDSAYVGLTRWEFENPHGEVFWEAHRVMLRARLPFRNFEYQLSFRGRVYWVSASGEPVYDPAGNFAGYRGTSRDITRQKETEEALRISEERFGEMVNLMPVSVFIKDAQSRIAFINRECERQWGVRLAEVHGTDASHVFPSQRVAAFLSADRETFEAGKVLDYEETVWHAEMQMPRRVRTFKKPVFDKDGTPRYLIGIRIDVTEKRETEEQLRRSEESIRQLALHQAALVEEERKRIARDIHDELGQNLMALRIEASRLVSRTSERHMRLSGSAGEVLQTIDETIRSVRQIINNLRPAVLDLGLPAAIEWQVNEFGKRSGLHCLLNMQVDESELQLPAETATSLFRVLQESLTNVERHARASSVHVTLRTEDHALILNVSDDGIGMTDAAPARKGFGVLGMKERVRMIGGELRILGTPNRGTTLSVFLPLSQPQRNPAQMALPSMEE